LNLITNIFKDLAKKKFLSFAGIKKSATAFSADFWKNFSLYL
jgi:hypothetical protein